MPGLRDALRSPASTLTGLVRAPQPGTPGHRLFHHVTVAHVRLYRVSGGRIGGRFDRAPVLLLHHVGRRTGQARVTPLLHVRDGDDLVVVASMGGIPRHPAWFHNLMAMDETEVEVGRERRRVRPRVASSTEKGRLWPTLVAAYPAYATYQARTQRDIPVVLLERV
ncbi:nitroreductase family deazaflavin-dependent oxidoreductase [Conexibacter sp. SYSU D00693]|uniref:nitroreductase family deazaflavin-dependent oxidoreductase n=1 Tax=Conexibacter sp. SYSU D00693 TaxID=2812560 RepID=UPI00196A3E47|nr:nitroreductase family deazaflavin-dependent oxidoreductase [Conexibacter sp. SYSU D00693]